MKPDNFRMMYMTFIGIVFSISMKAEYQVNLSDTYYNTVGYCFLDISVTITGNSGPFDIYVYREEDIDDFHNPYIVRYNKPTGLTDLGSIPTDETFYVVIIDEYDCEWISEPINEECYCPVNLNVVPGWMPGDCNSSNGMISLDFIQGGTEPYTVIWGDDTIEDHGTWYGGFSHGTYGVTVTDAVGCVKTAEIDFIAETEDDIDGCECGDVNVSISNGNCEYTANYTGTCTNPTFQWFINYQPIEGAIFQQFSMNYNNNYSGNFTVAIFCDGGCEDLSNLRSAYCPNPSCYGSVDIIESDCELSLNIGNSTTPIVDIAWTTPNGNYIHDVTTLDASGMSGTFSVSYVLSNGCFYYGTYTIEEPCGVIDCDCQLINPIVNDCVLSYSIQGTGCDNFELEIEEEIVDDIPDVVAGNYTYEFEADGVKSIRLISDICDLETEVTFNEPCYPDCDCSISDMYVSGIDMIVVLSGTGCDNYRLKLSGPSNPYGPNVTDEVALVGNNVFDLTNKDAGDYQAELYSTLWQCYDITYEYVFVGSTTGDDDPCSFCSLHTSSSPSQHDEPTGSITLSPICNPPYNYVLTYLGSEVSSGTWSSQDLTIDNLADGTYYVTITDPDCEFQSSIVVDENVVCGNCSLQLGTTLHLNCDSDEATVSVIANNCDGFVQFAWSGSPTSYSGATATYSTGGIYNVTATDAAGCTSNIDFEIQDDRGNCDGDCDASFTIHHHKTCDDEYGSASIDLSDGCNGPVNFNWSHTNVSIQSDAQLAPDDYSVTVTDANGSTDELTFTIDDNAQDCCIGCEAVILSYTDIDCNADDGTAEVGLSGDCDAITGILWSFQGATTSNVILPEGTHQVTITTGSAPNDCTYSTEVTIAEDVAGCCIGCTLDSFAKQDIDCDNETGTATLNVTGCKGPIKYVWTKDGDANPLGQFFLFNHFSVSGLEAGDYEVVAIDADDCRVTQSFTIAVSPEDCCIGCEVEFTNVNHADCQNPNGTAQVGLSGTCESITSILWSNNGTNAFVTLPPNNYTVTVNTANCQYTGVIEIEDQSGNCGVSITVNNHVDCFNANGWATANTVGCIGDLQYAWSSGHSDSSVSLYEGYHTLTVTDANGCSNTATVQIKNLTGNCECDYSSCDDGNPCTINDTEGIYGYDASICQPCAGTLITCNSELSTVETCNDGNPNTINDVQTILDCDGSICVPCAGVAPNCSPNNTIIQTCNDGNPCTFDDTETVLQSDVTIICVPCSGIVVAVCTLPSTVQNCDDNNPCTINDIQEVDYCDNSIVCVPCAGIPIDCDTGPFTVQSCDDGNANTINDEVTILTCDGNICIPCAGTPTHCSSDETLIEPCNDNNPCTVYDKQTILQSDGTICKPCMGITISDCSKPPTIQGCDDGDRCTINDTQGIDLCNNIVCIPCTGTPTDCNSGLVEIVPCDDGNPNTINDVETILGCDESVCKPCSGTSTNCNSSPTTTQSCDDGDPCTTGDMETILDSDGSVCEPCTGQPVTPEVIFDENVTTSATITNCIITLTAEMTPYSNCVCCDVQWNYEDDYDVIIENDIAFSLDKGPISMTCDDIGLARFVFNDICAIGLGEVTMSGTQTISSISNDCGPAASSNSPEPDISSNFSVTYDITEPDLVACGCTSNPADPCENLEISCNVRNNNYTYCVDNPSSSSLTYLWTYDGSNGDNFNTGDCYIITGGGTGGILTLIVSGSDCSDSEEYTKGVKGGTADCSGGSR